MSYQNTKPATRWRHREKRPGVESAQAAHHGMESEVRYRVVTQGVRTYHETFTEAAVEYQVRRAQRPIRDQHV